MPVFLRRHCDRDRNFLAKQLQNIRVFEIDLLIFVAKVFNLINSLYLWVTGFLTVFLYYFEVRYCQNPHKGFSVQGQM